MPFIHIRSLPLEASTAISHIIEGISRDFSEETSTPIEHIVTSWEFFRAGCYAFGGKIGNTLSVDSHPILVDFLTPDFIEADTVEKMIECIADSLVKRMNILPSKVFINHRYAHSGRLFDAGDIVRW